MPSEKRHEEINVRLCRLADDIADLGVCSAADVKLVLFATESRFGHLVSKELLPGWKLISHCHIEFPGLLAGYIFSRKVINIIGGVDMKPWSTWEPPKPWPEEVHFKAREGSYRYFRIEQPLAEASEARCVLFVNIWPRISSRRRRVESKGWQRSP